MTDKTMTLDEAIQQLATMDQRVEKLRVRDEYSTLNTAVRQQRAAEQDLLMVVRRQIAARPMIYAQGGK